MKGFRKIRLEIRFISMKLSFLLEKLFQLLKNYVLKVDSITFFY